MQPVLAEERWRAVDSRTGPTVSSLKASEGSLGPRLAWEVTFSTEESSETIVGACCHVCFYSGPGKTPHDGGMPSQLGCQWSVHRKPFHSSSRSSDVWIFILCLQRVASPFLFWDPVPCPICLGPTVPCSESPASTSVCVVMECHHRKWRAAAPSIAQQPKSDTG